MGRAPVAGETIYNRSNLVSKGLLAAIQTTPVISAIDYSLNEIERALATWQPAENRLVVFPEMATTGYFLGIANT